MKFLIKKIYIILFLFIILFSKIETFAKDYRVPYTKENISNYFLGMLSVNKDYNAEAFKHLKKVKKLKNTHPKFNIEFVRTLVLLEEFDKALDFSKSAWKQNEFFFEADLLLGLNLFLKKDYVKAEKYFNRLNKISSYNPYFDDLIGNTLIAWSKASQDNKAESFKFLNKIPETYRHLKNTQNIFLKCYFDDIDTQKSFEALVGSNEYNFSRYNFFLANYLLYKNKKDEAKKVIKNSRKKYASNLLLKETEYLLSKNKSNKVKNLFNCKNPKDSIAEFFYVIANLYSGESNYQLSNFYLKVSSFLNKNFLTNNALLAENFYFQKKHLPAKKIYESIQSIGPIYSWHASKNIFAILKEEKDIKYSFSYLEKEFNLLPNLNFEHDYELANIYKDNKYFEKSIKYYSLSLSKIDKNHLLIPKILDRRGSSYERLGDWKNAEKDLIKSLEILPDQPHVLNYLAYTWIDKGINLDKGLEMLKKANSIRKDDGYIIDSLGWAYYMKKNYIKAEKYLQRAVELLPSDPVINDHYADSLWMLNKNIQARYIWSNILKLDTAEPKLKEIVSKKLIFGIT